jgi:hypothetical protein
MRDNNYLEEQLYDIWENHFADVPRKNYVVIKFGKYSRRQLGSIKWASKRTKIKGLLNKIKEDIKSQDDKRVTVITITKYFQHEEVPDEVVRQTIAHELVHYTHGFHSPLKQIYKHPHRGRIVEKELHKRGLQDTFQFSEEWLKKNWLKTLRKFS